MSAQTVPEKSSCQPRLTNECMKRSLLFFAIKNYAAIGLWLCGMLLWGGPNASAQCIYLANTDFEISGQNPGGYVIASQNTLVPPWRTTAADGMMEVWHSGYLGVRSFSGGQHIELNANIPSTAYQNFTAVAGQTFTLNFAHRGRAGTDVMNVSIGSPNPTSIANSTAITGTVYQDLGNFTDGNTNWGYYSVPVTLPVSVTGTVFAVRFTVVSSAINDKSYGNFLDAISLGDPAPELTGHTLTVNCAATITDLASFFPSTNSPPNTVQTWHNGPVATSSNLVTGSTPLTEDIYFTSFYDTVKGCYGATAAVTITRTGSPPAPTLTTLPPSCTSTKGGFMVTPTGSGYTYSIDGITYTNTTGLFTGLTAGTYTIRARNMACTSAPASITLTAQPLAPVASATTVGAITCTQSATVTGASSVTGSTYAWRGPNGFTASAQRFTTTVPGTYTLAVSASGCTTTLPAKTTVVNPITATWGLTADTTGPLTCSVASAVVSAGSSTTGLSYQWNSGQTTATFSTTLAGVYSVTATDVNGCTAMASTTLVANNAVPVVTLNSLTLTCAQPAGVLSASVGSGSGPYGYQWTGGATSQSVTVGTGGVYSVTATGSNGCLATAATTVVSNTAAPNLTPLNSLTLTCTQPTDSLSVMAVGGTAPYTYYWNTGSTSSSVVVSSAGSYSVTVTGANGCSAVAAATVSANLISPVITLNSLTLTCAQPTGMLSATASGGSGPFAYRWHTTATNAAIPVSAGGVYSVMVTGGNGCSATAVTTVVSATAAPSLTVYSLTACDPFSGSLTAGLSGSGVPYTYLWSNGATTPAIAVTDAGTYTVAVTDANGCSAVASGNLTINPAPVVTINSVTICTGLSATLTVSGCTGGTVLWSTGGSGISLIVNPLATTVYSAVCTLPAGCQAAALATVTVRQLPVSPLPATVTSASCAGATVVGTGSIDLNTLLYTERVDVVPGATYGTGPAYGAATNQVAVDGLVHVGNLPNPISQQPYTIRLFGIGGVCTTDVTVNLNPADCKCPPPACLPLAVSRIR